MEAVPRNAGAYPVYCLELSRSPGSRARARNICLAGGIHGDEPAGVEALLTWLENPDRFESYLEDFNFTIFPCINPFGFEHDTRENELGGDLNRKFDRKRPPPEVDFVRRMTHGRSYRLSMEFHEDVDTEGFYLYEIKERRPFLGELIIEAVGKSCPINHRENIEGLPSAGGVIRPPIQRILQYRKKDWPQAIYLFRNGARHCITCETPVTPPLETRTKIHTAALDCALRALL